MKVLVTGCLGLIGNHFCRYLCDQGHSVVGIDDCSGGFIDYLDHRINFHKFDLVELDKLEQVFEKEKPDFVYHFAAYASEGLSDYIKNYNYQNNVVASVNVINCCVNHDVKKIIFTSSMAVMGVGSPPFKETDSPKPVDSYGLAKLTVEKELELSYEKFGLKYNIIRPHNVIASHLQNYADVFRNVLSIWINRVLHGKSITIYGDGKQKRAFSDVKYCMKPFEMLMHGFDGEIFNIGADKEITILEAARLTQKIATEFGYEPEIEFLEPRTEVKFAYSDHSKAKVCLNFKDETNLESVIRDMFLWVKRQPAREVRKMPYEIEKNMYSFWKEHNGRK